MSQDLQLFAGGQQTLMHFRDVVANAPLFALAGGVEICVLPLDEELHDALHAAYGTGNWLRKGPRLSTGDMAFAARVSTFGPLAYIEISGDGDDGGQCAAVWQNGTLAAKPMTLKAQDQRNRPRTLWPINIALKQIGVTAAPGLDEAHTIGLNNFASNEDIKTRAVKVA